jgi:hypothetical protein
MNGCSSSLSTMIRKFTNSSSKVVMPAGNERSAAQEMHMKRLLIVQNERRQLQTYPSSQCEEEQTAKYKAKSVNE